MAGKTFDLAIVGAGVFGLQLARQALLSGLSVCVLEARTVASGASGGVLGALMPHIPDRWDAKKQFQYEALVSLESECELLTEQTNLPTGYGRIGRIMPLRKEKFVAHVAPRAAGAKEFWADSGHSFDRTDFDPKWMNAEIASFGAVLDNLAARINPRLYMAALAKFVRQHKSGAIFESTSFEVETLNARSVTTPNGEIAFDQCAIAAGFQSFTFLQSLTGLFLGSGVKGQARLVACDMPVGTPIIYDDGCYIVPHDNGTVAIGSTSQRYWSDEHSIDPDNWDFFERAIKLAPALQKSPIVGEWAGVRPRAEKVEPIVGKVPNHNGVYVFTGGFKVSLGIAHHAARWLVSQIKGEEGPIVLPQTFTSEHHFSQSD